MWTGLFIVVLGLIFIVKNMFIIVSAREEVIKEKLGKYVDTLKPGFHLMVPIIDSAAYRMDMREHVVDVPVQTCITNDNVQVMVDGVLYLKVMDSYKAAYGIGNYVYASINLAQTTMRSEIGKMDLDSTFAEREHLNSNIVQEIDKASDAWGIKVLRYEIQNITPANKVLETLEKQMEAERTKRAEITLSSGKRNAMINLSEGERTEAINMSEAEKQKRINEAEGKALEITMLAEASAKGIKRVSEAIAKPGGALAVKTQLLDQYFEELGKILATANITVLPTEVANVKAYFEGLAQVTDRMGSN